MTITLRNALRVVEARGAADALIGQDAARLPEPETMVVVNASRFIPRPIRDDDGLPFRRKTWASVGGRL